MSSGARLGASLIALVCLVMLGGGAVMLWYAEDVDDSIIEPGEQDMRENAGEGADAPSPIAVPDFAVPTKEVKVDDGPTMVDLPDGTSVPNLNGVTDKVRFTWTPRRPYSPIIGKRPAAGPDDWEWYEHADGSLSTTVMIWRSDLGRKDSTHVVAAPTADLPLDPRVAQKMYEEGMLGANPPGGSDLGR
jgi:hypothetical protein